MADARWHKVYLPEIHDLYPGMKPGADALCAVFPPAARDRVAWSIVPNWQGRLALTGHPDAAAELAALPGTPVLHGWTHSLGPDWINWVFYGHDNRSEFLRLSEAEAGDRIARGVAEFRDALGTAPRWFCAPRWQLSAGGAVALHKAGFAGHLSGAGIEVYGEGTVPLPALNFDEGERGWKQALARVARVPKARRLLARGTPFRLVIHPDDLRFPAVRADLERCVEAMEHDGWRALGLDEMLALWRQVRP